MVDCGFGVERMTADSSSGDFRALTHPFTTHPRTTSPAVPRKRKSTLVDFESDSDDDDKSVRTETDGKGSGSRPSNHSEIEKRRRDKMNLYITEISALVPMCAAMSRKLDKLTVLRLAVQHIKTLRGCNQSFGKGIYRPGCVSEEELSELLDKSSDGFLMIISCERGRIMHISERVEQTLGWTAEDLLSRSCFDLMKKEDTRTVKEQMVTSTLSETADHLDGHNSPESVSSSTGGLNGTLSCFCPGAKRFFYCRMKKKPGWISQGENVRDRDGFALVRCTGYLKFWPPPLNSSGSQELPSTSSDSDSPNFTSLVLHVVPQPPYSDNSPEPRNFTCRLSPEGRIQFADQNVSTIFGYSATEVLGRSYYDFIHEDDLLALAETHKAALAKEKRGEKVWSGNPYRVQGRTGFINVISSWKTFISPWSGDADFIYIKHTTVSPVRDSLNSTPTGMATSRSSSLSSLLAKMPQQGGLSNSGSSTKLGAGKMGQAAILETDSPKSHMIYYGPAANTESVKKESEIGSNLAESENVRGNTRGKGESEGGSEEATMSVLMRLLDGDPNLGQHSDYGGTVPWPI